MAQDGEGLQGPADAGTEVARGRQALHALQGARDVRLHGHEAT